MSVSKRLRYEILRRDNHTCRYCGSSAPDVALQVDHVVPKSLGGPDDPTNLVTSCEPCNTGKTSSSPDVPLVEDVKEDALRWSNAMQKAAELERNRAEELQDQVELIGMYFRKAWQPEEYLLCDEIGWHYNSDPERSYDYAVDILDSETGERLGRKLFDTPKDASAWIGKQRSKHIPAMPKNWRSTVKSWLAAGLTTADFADIVTEVATERDYVQWDHKWRYTAGCCWNRIRQRQAVAQALLATESADANSDHAEPV